MTITNIPEKYRVTERGIRLPAKHCPHSIAFPAMISSLKTFMGLPVNLKNADGWEFDFDYFFHMGVSGEGFTLCYSIFDLMKEQKWNNSFIEDSFAAEGIKYRLYGNEEIVFKDKDLNFDTIAEEIVDHLRSDLPVILLDPIHYRLVIGYSDFGNKLIVHSGENGGNNIGVHIGKTAKAEEKEKLFKNLKAVIFIDGLCEAADKKEIVMRALSRGYKMMTERDEPFSNYGYGEGLWWKWIFRLEDDRNYRAKSSSFRYIDPEKFDMAERRAFTAKFFEQSQKITGLKLSTAAKKFRLIHDKMWDIHWQVYGENKRDLRQRETRERIVWFLKECRDLEREAAQAVGKVLK